VSDYPVAVCVGEVASAAQWRSFHFFVPSVFIYLLFDLFSDAVISGECMIGQQGFGNGVGGRFVA
jgi:hypothetical protein